MIMRSTTSALLVVVLMSPGATAQEQWPTKKWPTTTPKDVGFDPAALAAFDADIVKGDYGYVDSLTFIRRDKVAFDKTYKHDYDKIYGKLAKEGYPNSVHDLSGPYNYYSTWWHPYYRRGDLHTIQSLTKPIVSAIIGVAVARKEFPDLDTPVMKFFDEKKVANLDDRKRRMTIRHLLTMTSGVHWTTAKLAEAGADTDTRFEASYDWVKFTIDLPMSDEPGKVYTYASGNVQLLVHIFNKAVGKDIEEYAAEHLFAPLGIDKFYWKRTPAGHVDGSGGLYFRPHDLAKLGYLYLHKGTWDGKQLVTADWVKDSFAVRVETPALGKGVAMGYLWRSMPYGEKDQFRVFGGGGFGNQGLLVFPDHDAVLVYTCWNALDDKPDLSVPAVVERFQRALADNPKGGKPPASCFAATAAPFCEVVGPNQTLQQTRPACRFLGLHRLPCGPGR